MTSDWRGRIEGWPRRLASLVEFLRASGYQFVAPTEVLPGPARDVERQLARIDTLIGPLPQAMRLFYQSVGSVDLRGDHPEWTCSGLSDPLVVLPIEVAVEEAEQYAALPDPRKGYWASESGIFRVPVAPDDYHKADVSGGMWLGVEVPNGDADPIVLEEAHALPFTAYVELVLTWGGFLGLEYETEHTWPLDRLRGAASLQAG